MKLMDRLLVPAKVTESGRRTGRFHHVSLETSAPVRWLPGQQIKVFVNGLRGPRRTYSVWDLRGCSLELRVLDHEAAGPGARWARKATPGDRIRFTGPEGGLVPRADARQHLFLGDETASAAFGPMMRALCERGAEVRALMEVEREEDRLPLPGAVTWTHRRGAFVEALADFPVPEAQEGSAAVAYVAGEARTIQSLRAHLTQERGWPRRSVVTKPFWCPGKKGLD